MIRRLIAAGLLRVTVRPVSHAEVLVTDATDGAIDLITARLEAEFQSVAGPGLDEARPPSPNRDLRHSKP
jgi:hypothetical protein